MKNKNGKIKTELFASLFYGRLDISKKIELIKLNENKTKLML